jgi:hypothetical protein
MTTVLDFIKDGWQNLVRNKLVLVLCALACLFVILFLFCFYIYPLMGLGPEQPIPFSHRIHSGVKQIQCEFCHPFVRRSRFPGIPPVEKCLFCHKYIIAGHPEIKKEHHYFDTNTSTPWRKANFLPEHVLFNHERHIKKDIVCKDCHGIVESMDRIKGIRFRMGFCIECHREKKANLDCWLACHG